MEYTKEVLADMLALWPFLMVLQVMDLLGTQSAVKNFCLIMPFVSFPLLPASCLNGLSIGGIAEYAGFKFAGSFANV